MGRLLVVTGWTGGLLVYSTVVWAVFLRGSILALGRIRGHLWHEMTAGVFSCPLHGLPSWSSTNVGAYLVVIGCHGVLLARSFMLCITFPHGRLLPLGRKWFLGVCTVCWFFNLFYDRFSFDDVFSFWGVSGRCGNKKI